MLKIKGKSPKTAPTYTEEKVDDGKGKYKCKVCGHIYDEAKENITALLKQSFRPEFLNRLDEIVFYKPLNKDDMRKIIDILAKRLERALCPRVHFKMMIFDLDEVYIGSANLTGAGIGMKSAKTRNFEAGILTDEPSLLDSAIEHFDGVWAGFRCKDCSRKKFCSDPIIG